MDGRRHQTQFVLLARDVIYTSRAYATMSVSVCLSVTEVHWRIIANLGFKFRSTFTAHCGHGACREEGIDHARKSGGIILHYASHCQALLFFCVDSKYIVYCRVETVSYSAN